MDDSLEIKKIDREIVELLVAKELNKFAEETATSVIDSMGDKKFILPDSRKWARKIISVIKEHSV